MAVGCSFVVIYTSSIPPRVDNAMDRQLTNGASPLSSDFLHPNSPPHHVRRLATTNLAVDRLASPSPSPSPSPTPKKKTRRRSQRKPWRKLLWVIPS
jgi:hypothetical protein